MIRILRHYGQEYEIWRGGTRGFDDILYFYSHGYAYNFLSRFLPGSMNARKLRTAARQTNRIPLVLARDISLRTCRPS